MLTDFLTNAFPTPDSILFRESTILRYFSNSYLNAFRTYCTMHVSILLVIKGRDILVLDLVTLLLS